MSRLAGLDALRGAAALLVLWFHLHHSHRVGFYPTRGYLAVDFFFMLSGYVMARTYEGRLKGGLWFMRKRLHRLWPTCAVGLLLGMAVYWRFASPEFWLVAAINMLLIPTLWTRAVFPLNSPIWSIFFELFANALHGFWLHKVRTSHLGVIVAAAGCISFAGALTQGHYNLGSSNIDFLGGFPRVIFAYFLGVILYRMWRDSPPRRFNPWLLVPLSVILFTPREPLGDFLFVALFCPVIMAIGIGANPGRWAAFAGGLSFPLYAVHRPILAITGGGGWLAGALGSILAAAILAPLKPRGLMQLATSRPASR